jgi:hypothetical protein
MYQHADRSRALTHAHGRDHHGHAEACALGSWRYVGLVVHRRACAHGHARRIEPACGPRPRCLLPSMIDLPGRPARGWVHAEAGRPARPPRAHGLITCGRCCNCWPACARCMPIHLSIHPSTLVVLACSLCACMCGGDKLIFFCEKGDKLIARPPA